MSCGLSKAMLAAADQVDALTAGIESKIMSIPGMAELDNLAATAQEAAQGVMDKLNDAIPSIKMPGGLFEDLPLQDQMKEIAGLIALGFLKKDELEQKLEFMKTKWSGVDVDIDNLADLLRSGAMDIDSICKMVPNVETDGINAVVKGIPTSFPDIDPIALIKGQPLPPMPKIDKVYVETTAVKKKKETDDFLNIELPTFDF